MKTVLITGITGFVGSHLADYILNDHPEYEVHGLVRWRSPMDNIRHITNQVHLHCGDLRDQGSLIRILDEVKPEKIFHLAAQSYVPTSFNAPIDTLETNVIGTTNLLEAVRITGLDPMIHICSCYDEQTELLTKRGFIKYNDIQEDDIVVSINPETEAIEYKPIKRIIIEDYSGEMKHIKTRSIDLLITPNHKLIFKKAPNKQLIFKEVCDITAPTSRCYFPSGKYSGIKTNKIQIGNKEYDTQAILYLMGLYIGDGYSDHRIKIENNKTGLSRKEFLHTARDNQGRFTSPETKGHKQKTYCNSYRIFLAIPEGDKARDKAINCLQQLGLKFSCYKKELYFSSKDFVEFLDEIGHSAETKCIPEWVFDYDSEYLEYLYSGLIDSDGHYDKTGQRFCSISKELIDSFTRLCLVTGKHITSSKTKPRKAKLKDGRIIQSQQPSYSCSISNNSRLIEGKNITSCTYNGKIWCLEIENNHNFVVRRNGKTMFCGNSSEVYGQVTEEDIPINESCPMRPASPYAVSKVGEDMTSLQYFLSYGIKTIRTRMFTHSGPRRGEVFVVSAFAKQVAEIEAGIREPIIKVGNLESVRTFADVRDTVKAYWMLLEKCKPGEVYNIGGNETMTVRRMLEKLIEMSSLSPDQISIIVDSHLLRPSDVTLQIPDCSKFKRETGWEPKIPFEDTLVDILDYWRGATNG